MWRLGIVDFDSSHCVEFARRFNQVVVDREQYVEGARVVAAWPGHSVMAPERIPGFQKQLEAIEIPLVDRAEDLIGQVDAVLVLSLCGSAHLERVQPFLEAGIPAFVDKPFACSLGDAVSMVEAAQTNQVTLFNASAMRFAEETRQVVDNKSLGRINGAITFGPSKRASGSGIRHDTNPGLFHYGIHSVELLFELMGPGCETVTSVTTPNSEVVTGQWSDGRIGTVRGNRTSASSYGFVAFCDAGPISKVVSTRFAYRNLCQAIVSSFENKVPTVSHESNLDVVKFILAAIESEKNNGATVKMAEVF
jgi:virulence factor